MIVPTLTRLIKLEDWVPQVKRVWVVGNFANSSQKRGLFIGVGFKHKLGYFRSINSFDF